MHIEELSLLAVGGLVLVVGVSMLASKLGIATPLILVILGIGIGYFPGIPLIEIDPNIILLGVLPPLLYAAAVNVPMIDLRRNIGPIAGLSVVLVLITALLIGVIIHALVPAIPFAAAVALGAVVAPTDAVAATSIGKRLGMPPRLVTILEGESLVNDATSLVLLRTALIAITGGFAFWDAAGLFGYAVLAALAVGLLVGIVTVWVRAKLENPVYDTVVSFAVPFIAFVPTEYIGASGVLAVVVTGLYSGHHASKRFSATARVNERLNWRTLMFLLENGVFLLMGLELHKLVDDVAQSDLHLDHTALLALVVVAALILLRMLFIAPLIFGLNRTQRRYESRAKGTAKLAAAVADRANKYEYSEVLDRRVQRVRLVAKRTAADANHAREQGLDWRGGVIIGWSGMRGVVTLAAAQSIPASVPYRSQLVLIAFLAAAVTLLLHGFTLPALIRKLRPQGPSANARSEELISLYRDLVAAGNEALEVAIKDEAALAVEDPEHHAPSERIIKRARSSVVNSIAALAYSLPPSEDLEQSGATAEALSYMRLANSAIEAQRELLLEERAIGQYSSQALRAASEALDQHELRLTPPTHH